MLPLWFLKTIRASVKILLFEELGRNRSAPRIPITISNQRLEPVCKYSSMHPRPRTFFTLGRKMDLWRWAPVLSDAPFLQVRPPLLTYEGSITACRHISLKTQSIVMTFRLIFQIYRNISTTSLHSFCFFWLSE